MRNRPKLSFEPYMLKLKHPFSVAWGTRRETPVVLTRIEFGGLTGYGEASMPPYLGESVDSVTRFLTRVNLPDFSSHADIEGIMDHINTYEQGNYAAKASIDIAMHDLAGKMAGTPLYNIWGLNPDETPFTSFTIGIDTREKVIAKVEEASEYKILKIKLGGDNDREIIESVREVTDKLLYVDVNQGWTDKDYALDMIYWLKEQNVAIIEQPMPDSMEEDLAWLIDRSPLPVFADEGIKTVADMERRKGFYHGVNIKLMKCGGLLNARRILDIARQAGMNVMIGCMTETSCAVSAAAQLSPSVDYADLDGNLLIDNDCFTGIELFEGKIVIPNKPGIGIEERNPKF